MNQLFTMAMLMYSVLLRERAWLASMVHEGLFGPEDASALCETRLKALDSFLTQFRADYMPTLPALTPAEARCPDDFTENDLAYVTRSNV